MRATGEEATQLAVEHAADVVVMDVEMPGIGGIEATRRLVERRPEIRVVAFSSNAAADRRMRDAGAAAFVWKGADPSVLLTAIRSSRADSSKA